MSSMAFLAEAHVATEFQWTCAGSQGPYAHHIEAVLQHEVGELNSVDREESTASARRGVSAQAERDLWIPYRATGLQLKVAADISPNKISEKPIPDEVARAGSCSQNGPDNAEVRVLAPCEMQLDLSRLYRSAFSKAT